ncbi:MAG: hybrid sensor histidine kinase/response regulator [Deltaproteobacteria bacterium]|nr:hybrid sensor histidine kinase/response regulator [Deltaproteobacteria bacterium]
MDAILCVDDDRTGVATVARTLREIAPVLTAHSGREARAALGPDVAVVVSDYRMPAMLGTELLAEVRARDATTGRILLTAYADVEGLMDAINHGHVHRYVPKPWDPRELRAAVRQAHEATVALRAKARLDAETARAYHRLRELDGLRARFLALAAHELRTPLHVIGAALDALGDMGLDPDAAELVATAHRHAGWLGRSVAAMTDLVRLSRPGPRRHGTVCLATIVRRAAADVRSFCARRRLSLVVQVPDACGGWGDGADLQRALLNLCLNAVRFTPDGGRVSLRLAATPEGAEVAVADTGIGIASALRARLGEPFVTGAPLDAHHSDPIAFGSGGLGLGLAVVRAIAADHGGDLRIASEEGVGTVATLVLPVRRPDAAPIDSPDGRRDNAP